MPVARYFLGSLLLSLFAIAMIVFFIPSWSALFAIIVLALLELSLSFDNAVINARVLATMSPQWRKRFIFWGLPVAVFGMRLIFPIGLVAATTQLDFIQTIRLALHNPAQYHHALEHGYPLISAFGGAFLLMVSAQFFLHRSKNRHWIGWLENQQLMKHLRRIPFFHAVLVAIIGLILWLFTQNEMMAFAFILGWSVQLVLSSFVCLISHGGSSNSRVLLKYGFLGFLYLEVLDASFSFDGVVGAFAVTTNIFIIMVGLGIGALFVRSLTLFFVERKTLSRFIYLEHGAHYAIGFLAIVLLLKNFIDVPELLTGFVSIGLIVLSVISSWSFRT